MIPFNGLGSTPAMDNRHLQRQFISQLLYLASPLVIHCKLFHAADTNPYLPILLTPVIPDTRTHEISATPDHRHSTTGQCQSAPPEDHHFAARCLRWSRAADSTSTSHHHDKRLCAIDTLFRGLGSTPAMADHHLQCVFLGQVKIVPHYLLNAAYSAALLVLPSPGYVVDIAYCSAVTLKLLLLCGDVEENPVLTTRSSSTEGSCDIMSTLDAIRPSQKTILNKMKSIRTALSQHKKTFDIISRLLKIENDCSTPARLKTQVDDIQTLAAKNSNVIDTLSDRIDSSEDRTRLSNLLFLGFYDDDQETWSQSEQLVLKLCNKTLHVSLDPRSVERAHRIGRFQVNKIRPIGVRFLHYEDKENVLWNAKRLTNSGYSTGQDSCPNTRFAQKRLIKIDKSQPKPSKLRHERRLIAKPLTSLIAVLKK
ncbi:hypothetical protein HPB48_012269 [Haemaphysalis longicornis]|uniref:Uncharacterized protein n=1 Tax=Haemaphysalis longicornis TaxID=44386 RepID=A0A9J6GX44_HAELO|nr:hypothetical protein HPB48_012269 [Haemaphysalis longicornis]